VDRDIKIEPQGYIDSELKQPHTAKRPKFRSEKDRDTKIEPEINQPHSTARQRLSSAASDTKSEPDGGYLASESSESPESEGIKTQSKRKNSNKDRHSARPPGSTSSDSSEEFNPPSISYIVASDTATLVYLHTPQAHAGLTCNTQLCSENGNESLSDGDCLYIQPCEEQNPQVYVSIFNNLFCLAIPPRHCIYFFLL
jgi:hypothetical protein